MNSELTDLVKDNLGQPKFELIRFGSCEVRHLNLT